jgi:[histone H3]-lysine36 N-dimethyltransferase SETMAR
VKLIEIAETLKISKERVGHIAHENLDMPKLFAKWLPRLLTIDQNQQRVDDSEQCLAIFNRKKDEFFRRYITMDVTWLLHNTPESNRQSAVWTQRDKPNPKRGKTQRYSVLRDARGIIFIDYLEKDQSIHSEYNIALLERLNDKFKKICPHLKKKKVLFHQDNASVHKSIKTTVKLHELGYELFSHPPYSPDLAPVTFLSL